MRIRGQVFAIAVTLVMAANQSVARAADDSFFDIPLSDLKITSGELPVRSNTSESFEPWRWETMMPRVVLDGPGEAYLNITDRWAALFWNENGWGTCHLSARAPAGKEVTGILVLPSWNAADTKLIKFSIPDSAAKDAAKEAFLDARLIHYTRLQQRSAPGAAWFRYEVSQTQRQLKELLKHDANAQVLGVSFFPPERATAYELFSGGRALSESLQLDRTLRGETQKRAPTVRIDTLQGITVAKIDWKLLLKDANPKLDPLSKRIPADQHAVFFPSMAAVAAVLDEANSGNDTLLKLAASRSEDDGVLARYEHQLGVTLSDLDKIVGPAGVKTIALTGSDPYFSTGSDVAVLFETDQPQALAKQLQGQIESVAAKQPEVKSQSAETHKVSYQAFRSPDRKISSYVAALDGAVVLTNSLAQLEQLAQVGSGVDSIATLDEFKFFRARYPLGDKKESAFVFLSDPTIRRWCSPRWRIASARRTFTAAVLAELTAENAKAIVAGKSPPTTLHTDVALVDAGELTLADSEVASSTQGALAWMTPIIELPIENVTRAEADAYNLWREAYQQNWRWAFDPIGLRIEIEDQKLAADLTVMPLIAGSEYNLFMSIARGAEIKPHAGDPHGALLHLIMSLNIQSDPMRQWNNMAASFAPQAHIDPFSWLGSSVSLYLDDDPLWKKLAGMSPEDLEKFKRSPLKELPIALQAEVSSPLKLTAFLAALRAFIEQTSPGMVNWEALSYRDLPYVRIKPTEQARKSMGQESDLEVYYVPSGESLLITLNETVLKHALDRRLARDATPNNSSGEKTPDEGMPWLGSNLCLQVDRKMFDLLGKNASNVFDQAGIFSVNEMQIRSWSNLPILNQWKRLFPEEDPVVVHERLWKARLVDPAGGKYVWNDQWRTMESTVYGHPGQPKNGPTGADALNQFKAANFGLTFEDQGLRGKVEWLRAPKKGD